MKKKLSITEIQNLIIDKEKFIFTPLDLQRYFNVSYDIARVFISRNVKKGLYTKIKRGVYFDKKFAPNEFEIANRLYEPSYVSFEYALMYYNIIPEMVYTITSATTKATREFSVNNIIYSYSRFKKKYFTGYIKKDIGGRSVYVAEPEKALVDYLYFVSLGKKALNDRIDLKKIDYKKLIYFSKIFKRKSLDRLIKQTYDESNTNQEIIY